MRQTVLFYTFILCFSACGNLSNRQGSSPERDDHGRLPEGAIPMVYSGYIQIMADIEGIQGNFLLDAGAYNLLLDMLYFRSEDFSFNNIYETEISGIGNAWQKIFVINDEVDISFGNLNFQRSDVPVLDLKSAGGDFVDGLIGIDFFFNTVLEINYVKEYFKTYKSIDQVDISDYQMVPFEIINHFICIPVTMKINNTTWIHGNFILETGTPVSIITSSAAKENNLGKNIERKVYYYTQYGGIGGESSSYDFIAESIQISEFVLENVNMSYSLDTAGVLAGEKYLGIIGNDILERFDMLWDFNNHNLYVRPNESFDAPFIFDREGFTHVDRSKTLGGWVVTGLTKNSEAEKQGLRIDDLIILVNEIPVEEIPYDIQNHYFDDMDKVKLVVKGEDGLENFEFMLTPLL